MHRTTIINIVEVIQKLLFQRIQTMVRSLIFHFLKIFIELIIIQCLELYTPDQWEIDKDAVTLHKLIGQGHFGQVYQGVIKLSDGTLKPCAVKVKNHISHICSQYLFYNLFLASNNSSNRFIARSIYHEVRIVLFCGINKGFGFTFF